MPKKRTLRALTKELMDTPFLPLLFISEAIKIAALGMAITGELLTMVVLSVVATVAWVLSDSIDVDLDTDSIVGDE